MKKSYVKSVLTTLVASAILLFLLASCGSSKPDVSPETFSGQTTVSPHESETNEIDPAGSKTVQAIEHTTNVVCPEFSLTEGFIIPVKQQAEVPDGFIGISSEEDFTKIGLNPGGNYILLNDLDISNVGRDAINSFSGIFDGNGHTITNNGGTTTNDAHIISLFRSVTDGGIIRNLGVHCSAQFDDYISGGIIIYTMRNATIDNCFTDGAIDIGGEDFECFGGLVGEAASSEINNCYNQCNMSSSDEGKIGGVVFKFDSTTISNCYNAGNIICNGKESYAAGISVLAKPFGLGSSVAMSELPAEINNSFNIGSISANNAAGILCDFSFGQVTQLSITRCYNAGVIVGSSSASGIGISRNINDCYNSGNISGETAFGIAYDDYGKTWSNGIYGTTLYCASSIYNCYNIGSIIAEENGGICSENHEPRNMQYCYYIDNIAEATPQGALYANVEKLTGSELKQESSFKGFDFENTWRMGDDNYPYPVFLPAY